MLSLSRLIHDKEPFGFTIDKDRMISIPVELNRRINWDKSLTLEDGTPAYYNELITFK